MILVDSLLYGIDQKLNKLSSNSHQEIQLEDKILVLNEAQILLIKQKLDGFSPASNMLGLDSFKKRYEDLENLVLPYSEGKIKLSQTDSNLNMWSGKLTTLKEKYMFYIDAYILADKGNCKDHKIWVNPDLAKHHDVSKLLSNEHTRPSFEWQETFRTFTQKEINIFSDGTFTPSDIYLSYLRYPVYIDSEGYQKFDGSDSVNQNCELEDYLQDELIDITVQRLGMYTENHSAIQNAEMRIRTNE